MWSGSARNVPLGWEICDGTNGTPNLSGLIPRGVDEENAVGKTGGSKTHTHGFEVKHASVDYKTRNADGKDWPVIDTNQPITLNYQGQTSEAENAPPYFSVYFILKQSL